MKTTNIAIHGATGRMGDALIRSALDQSHLKISAALVRPASECDGEPLSKRYGANAPDVDFSAALDPDTTVDVLIDFSQVDTFDAVLALVLERKLAFVCGTTGLSNAQFLALKKAAQIVPVIWASNFSLGVAVLTHLVEEAVKALPDWDCEIVDTHHRHKVDAPSGTALSIGEAVAAVKQKALTEIAAHGRSGRTGERPSGEVGFHALRGGDVVGDHTVFLGGIGERLELTHRAHSRDVFAVGALHAAKWLAGRKPGMYALRDLFAG